MSKKFNSGDISKRTKEALAAAKARGVLLGSRRPGHWSGREEARMEGQRKATEAAAQKRLLRHVGYVTPDLMAKIKEYRSRMSLRAIAKQLNDGVEVSPTGFPWSAMMILRLLARDEKAKAMAKASNCRVTLNHSRMVIKE